MGDFDPLHHFLGTLWSNHNRYMRERYGHVLDFGAKLMREREAADQIRRENAINREAADQLNKRAASNQ